MRMSDGLLDEEIDEAHGVEVAIAQGLADLSAATVVPLEVDASSEFEADEVSFESSGWLADLVRIQDWLSLGDRLDPLAPPAVLASQLIGLLAEGADPSEFLVLQDEDQVAVTLKGLNLVRERIERATDL